MRIRSISPVPALLALVAATFLGPADTANAQQIVATTIVDGKKVELLDNSSWRFVATNEAGVNCNSIAGDVTFCGAPNVWKLIPPPNAQIPAAFIRSDTLYGLVISEGVGSTSGISIDAVRKIAIQNGAGVMPANVLVAEVFTSKTNSVTYTTAAYTVAIDGVPVYYLNSIFVGPKRTLQMVTYELNQSLTDYHKDIHQEFLNATQVSQ